jgi:ribosomal protein S18 acetylase RimI-like enzyme
MITHATGKDLDFIDALWGITLPGSVYMGLSIRELQTYIENNQVLIAIVDSKIVAAMQYEVRRGTCLFHHVAVDIMYRGQKVATRLIRYALESAKKQNACWSAVWVLENNQGALLFYENIGYRKEMKHTKRFILKEI